jgi:PPOX class probable F420-dependent enzyme
VRSGLGIDELEGFLDEPLVAVMATHRRDGSVLLSPVWHEWRDGGFNVWVGRDDVKASHVRRDPRVSIVVAESRYPIRAIELRCEAKIVEQDAEDTAIRLASRYVGSDRGRAYVQRWSHPVTLRLEPGEIRAWDYRDEAAYMETWS